MRRRRGGNVSRIGLIACCLALLGAGAAPAAAGPGFFTGVVESDGVAELGPLLADLGAGGARIWIEWEPHEAAADEEAIAAVRGSLEALPPGARLLVSVGSSGANAPLDAAARDRYCRYVRSLLTPFPSVRDVGIWNEPNKTANWRPQFDAEDASAAPAAYVALLARCWDILHAFRPGVNVVAPSTSPSGNDNPEAPNNISHSPRKFVRAMGEAYRASGRTRRIFDTVSHHPYGKQPRERPWLEHGEPRWTSQGDWGRLVAAFDYAFAGTAQPPPGRCDASGCVWIWYTEGGFQTEAPPEKAEHYTGTETVSVIPDDAGGEPDEPPPAPSSHAPDRRTQIVDALRLAACQPYVQAFFNYRLVDEAELNRWQSGFLWADGSAKPSYPYAQAAIAEAAAGAVDCGRLKGGPAPAPDTVPPRASPRVRPRPGIARVTLSWAASPDSDVMGYQVERAPRSGGPWTRLTAEPVRSPFVDRSAVNGRTYRYAVRAVDTVEQEGARSAAACATPTRALESYTPRALRGIAGRLGGSGRLARLQADDGRRVSIRSVRRKSGHRAVLEAVVRRHACARAPARLSVLLDARARRGVRLALLARNPRTGRWVAAGSRRAAAADRPLRARVPARYGRTRALRVRVVVTGPRAFRAGLDLVRLDVR